MVRLRCRQILSFMIVAVIALSLIPLNTVHAASEQYIEAWLISKPGFYAHYTDTFYLKSGGNIYRVGGGGGFEKLNLSGGTISGTVLAHTDFDLDQEMPLWHKTWGKSHVFTRVSGSEKAATSVNGSYYVGNLHGGNERDLSESKSTWMPGPRLFNLDISRASYQNKKSYNVTISLSESKAKTFTDGTDITAATGFKFKSVEKLPPPDGGGGGGGDTDPEYPSQARVRLSISAEDSTMNYMNFSGTVGAEAQARDTTKYKDYGEMDEIRIDLDAFNEHDRDKSNGSGDTVRASLQGTLSKDANWLMGSGKLYSYSADAEAYVQLDDGDPDYAEESDTANGSIVLTNEMPNCTWNLQSENQNGGSVPNGFYYVGVPAKLDVKFTDPENDIDQIQLYIQDEDKHNTKYVNMTYSTGSQSNQDLDDHSIKIENKVASINGYSSTMTFKKPGIYYYSVYVADAKSNAQVRETKKLEGTFLVRAEPEPPTAIISSPTYAFENESFKVTQDSTDPNGVDDIRVYKWTNAVDVTEETSPDDVDETFKPMTPSCSWPGNNSLSAKNGGSIVFPTGSAHHNFKINLAVTDATNLSDNVDQIIRVISDVPVAQLDITDNNGSKTVKENRKITVNAANSLAPAKSPIIWNECKWTIKSVDGKQEVNIHEDTTQRNGNKQRVLQFDKPGKYTVTVELVNNFSKQNPGHEDIGAATQTITIEVIEDVVPKSEVKVISAKPNFVDNPVEHTVTFGVDSSSVDGDKIIAPSDYTWSVYEDLNDDGKFTSEELVPQNKLTFNSGHTQVSMQTKFEKGRHNVIKAIVTTKETFGEPTINKFLAADDSYIRKTTVETTEVVNWVPKIVITPDQGPNPIPPDQYNPKPGTPYEPVDIDGDGINDGTYIRAYTDDTFTVTTAITDEFPETAIVDWELQKKKHDGTYTTIDDSGSSWINSGKVTNLLGHDGGSCRIDSPGIYILKSTVTDDCGDTGTFTVNIRIYTLPQAVLESNPKYRFFNGNWITKENIRFDLRSDPTIVDDEWGVAWHRMYWDLDCWEITPLNNQKTEEIHIMTPTYSGKYDDMTPGTSKFTGKNSKVGGITGNSTNGNQPYRSVSFTEPGQYEFRYWGTNYGGKVTVPVKYTIMVEEDLPPNILGTVGATFYRDPNDGKRAKISLLGPYASILGREVLTIQSPDGDYIDYTVIEVIHDSNNNKLFTDNSDKKWLLEENKTTVNGLEYILEKIDPFA